eukprot:m.264060 g.264060  ORF g.264060 m.264060 type:complete len:444 (-) comp27504_c0_seq1:247-1578(-)
MEEPASDALLEEFAPPHGPPRPVCIRISAPMFAEQSATYTRKALEELAVVLSEDPSQYTRIQAKRRREDEDIAREEMGIMEAMLDRFYAYWNGDKRSEPTHEEALAEVEELTTSMLLLHNYHFGFAPLVPRAASLAKPGALRPSSGCGSRSKRVRGDFSPVPCVSSRSRRRGALTGTPPPPLPTPPREDDPRLHLPLPAPPGQMGPAVENLITLSPVVARRPPPLPSSYSLLARNGARNRIVASAPPPPSLPQAPSSAALPPPPPLSAQSQMARPASHPTPSMLPPPPPAFAQPTPVLPTPASSASSSAVQTRSSSARAQSAPLSAPSSAPPAAPPLPPNLLMPSPARATRSSAPIASPAKNQVHTPSRLRNVSTPVQPVIPAALRMQRSTLRHHEARRSPGGTPARLATPKADGLCGILQQAMEKKFSAARGREPSPSPSRT